MTGSGGAIGSGLFAILMGFVGGASALFAKEYAAPIFHEWRSRKRRQEEIYREYIAPLSLSCTRLLWRFKEILIDNRHHFLLTSARPFDYNEYKRTSTLYRIAVVMGWIRAIDIELSALPQRAPGHTTPLANEIARFQSALADGPHVEVFRLEQACRIWNLALDKLSLIEKATLAAQFEVQLYKLAGDELKTNSNFVKEMKDEGRLALCRSLSAFLTDALKVKQLDETLLAETSHQAGLSLSYREALIYRDWQEAIGDAMLEKDDASDRRYKVIGFRDFEKVLAQDNRWTRAFARSIDDVDFERADSSDFRRQQMRAVAKSVARMVMAIADSRYRDLIDADSAKVAVNIAALTET